jgi:hypothetical protein
MKFIIGDAIATGKEPAEKQMTDLREWVKTHGKSGAIYFDKCLKWCDDEGGRRCENGLAAKCWSDTAWNTFIQTFAEHSDFVRWYNALGGQPKIISDTDRF